jgi:hypothetical protein
MSRLGWFLIGVVIWASERLARPRTTALDYLLALLAHMVLAAVAVIGWVIDRLPLETSRAAPVASSLGATR